MRKKVLWIAVGALVLVSVAAAAIIVSMGRGPAQKEKSHPNVLLLTVDTLRADHLGVYGYSRNTSPHLDAFAKDGVVFQKARCNWPKTTPSFVSMLTGTYGRTNGVTGKCRKPLPGELTTIAEAMKRNGYATAAVVDNPNLSVKYQFNQGFDHFVEIWEQPGANNAAKVVSHALDWLRKNRRQPFFFWVHLVDPHAKYTPPRGFDTLFLKDALYRRNDRVLKLTNQWDGINRTKTRLGDHLNLNYYIAQYDGEIAYADSQIARLFDEMKRQEIYDSTMTIFTSDHGEELGEHGIYFEHGYQVYEATMHVPLIIRYPDGIDGGREVSENLTLLRLAPTILDYCGIPAIPQHQGKSLRPLLEGRDEDRKVVCSEGGYRNRNTGKHHEVVYEGEWKLIHYSNNGYGLFNLAEDPGERNDLSRQQKTICLRLKKELQQFKRYENKSVTEPPTDESQDNEEMSEAMQKQLKALGYID